MSRYSEPQLIFWEIIAVIHTFAGTLLIESISSLQISSPLSNLLFVEGLTFFSANLIVIGLAFDWKKNQFRIRTYKFDPKKISELLFIRTMNLFIAILEKLGETGQKWKFRKYNTARMNTRNLSFLQLTFWFSILTLFLLIFARLVA